MKLWAAMVLVSAAAIVGTSVVVAQRKAEQFARLRAAMQAGWDQEKAALEADIARLQNAPVKVESISSTVQVQVPVAVRKDPAEILQRLASLRPGQGAQRRRTIRQIVHELESLVELGPESLPVIQAFLAQNQDVEYSPTRSEEVTPDAEGGAERERRRPQRPDESGTDFRPQEMRAWASFRPRRAQPRLEFTFPPSLRIGLFDAVRDIGGEDAERILAEALGTTGRGVEVAYLTTLLEELAPGRYREVALTSARDLLANPPQIADPSRLDEEAKSYLYSVLSRYQDTAFAPTAATLLVGQDGRIDRWALSYLSETLKDQAMPAIYQAYNDIRVTNLVEKAPLVSLALPQAGKNPLADHMVKSVINNDALPAGVRAIVVQGLVTGGAAGGDPGDAPKIDPNDARARLTFLQSLDGQVKDERVARSIEMAGQNLQNIVEGKEPLSARESMRGLFGGTRGRGERGGRAQPPGGGPAPGP